MKKTGLVHIARPLFLVLSAVVFLTGCGTKRPPTEKMASAEVFINSARASDAQGLIELRRAEDRYEQAQAAMASKDYERAARLADEALIDARLAEAKVQSNQATAALADLRDSIEILRRELNR